MKQSRRNSQISILLFTSIFALCIVMPMQSVLGTPSLTARLCEPETGAGCPPGSSGSGNPPLQEPIVRLTNFRPDLHGLKFSNSGFVNQSVSTVPVPGTSQGISFETETQGRSGGMAYASLDFFFNNMTIPSRTDVPPDGDVLADYIFTRLLDSFLAPTAWKYVDWSFRPIHDTWFRDGTMTLTTEEIPKIMREIDNGSPVVVGLVNGSIPFGDVSQLREVGSENHQVVAYGYRDYPRAGVVEFLIYDNNHPDVEAVLKMDTQRSQITYTTPNPGGNVTTRSWKGFFYHDYLGPLTPPDIPPQPSQITITNIEPMTIMAREPTNIIVHAMNSVDGTPVDGEVIVDGVGTVGRTNTPFNFTFNTNSSLATGRITAQGYADAALTFRLSLPQLEVRAEPNSVEINTEAQITIYAIDSKTNASVTGQVVTNEAPNRIQRPIILGNTSEQITHTFVPARGDPVFEGDFVFFEPVYPTVTVVAPGYSDTVVPIDFTGDLPSELLPPPFIPLPTPDGTEEDIPPDAVCLEAPCPDEVPEDEEVRDRPEP